MANHPDPPSHVDAFSAQQKVPSTTNCGNPPWFLPQVVGALPAQRPRMAVQAEAAAAVRQTALLLTTTTWPCCRLACRCVCVCVFVCVCVCVLCVCV